MSSFTVSEALALLERTPAALRAFLADLPPSWVQSRQRSDSWCAHEIVAHLIHGERTDWVPRARHILEHGDATPFAAFDRTGHTDDAARLSLVELLDEFASLRAANLRTIRDLHLSDDALQRSGRHPVLGTVTLQQLLATWVVHDLNHINQMTRAMAAKYREAVGAWNNPDHLRILEGI